MLFILSATGMPAMRNDDDFDNFYRRISVTGVSPVWRVLAILAMAGAALLFMVVLALVIAYLEARHRADWNQSYSAGKQDIKFGGMDDPPDPDDVVNEGEPPNPPYPLVADLRQFPRPVPGEDPGRPPPQTAHDRFLALGQSLWTVPDGQFPQHLRVSPDGQNLAYVNNRQLIVGPINGPMQVVGADKDGNRFRRGQKLNAGRDQGVQISGVPVWSDDSLLVYFCDDQGSLRRYDVRLASVDTLAFHGDCPVPVPTAPEKLIFRRSRAVPKADMHGQSAKHDPTEIILADLNTQRVKVLVVEDGSRLTPLSVSPDGQQLLLVSEPADNDKPQPRRRQLFVLDLTKEAPVEPKKLGKSHAGLDTVCWLELGKSVVYAREQTPMPPDVWESDKNWGAGTDLFRLDLATGQETRLSRGGGHESPCLAGEDIYFKTWRREGQRMVAQLHRVSVAAARQFAAREPDLPGRDEAAWTRLIHQVLEDAQVPADAGGPQLSREVLARLADAFDKAYRALFKVEPPADLDALERQHRELQMLNIDGPRRAQFALVVGAVDGEYLRRHHGAVWHLTAGPLFTPARRRDRAGNETPFAVLMNPFQAARYRLSAFDDDDDEDPRAALLLRYAVEQAEGRTLVLANDSAAGRKAATELADPDLARGLNLLNNHQGAEADRALLDLVAKPKHTRNAHLILHVGKLLHDHKRHGALLRLLEKRAEQPPRDARKHNLLGLALLDTDRQRAIFQFKLALRCDLYCGPAYLNLAQVYQLNGDDDSAALCLRRYLKLMPWGLHADDARQRLAAINAPRR
jgi:Tol biopolymer transport system component